ncbi:MAG TPA: hypothetical protein VG275_07775 [Solirubrobacteraceae bacterium]|nr:hypothetical protein [Solirubrobacteraceae bacterium]
MRSISRLVAPVVAALALAVPATASAAGFTAHFYAPNHTPIANQYWHVTTTATHNGTKLSGSVRYQFLFGGTVVSSRPGGSFKDGVFHDKLRFPNKSVGISLTLRVVVKTKYGTDHINWAVKVRA